MYSERLFYIVVTLMIALVFFFGKVTLLFSFPPSLCARPQWYPDIDINSTCYNLKPLLSESLDERRLELHPKYKQGQGRFWGPRNVCVSESATKAKYNPFREFCASVFILFTLTLAK